MLQTETRMGCVGSARRVAPIELIYRKTQIFHLPVLEREAQSVTIIEEPKDAFEKTLETMVWEEDDGALLSPAQVLANPKQFPHHYGAIQSADPNVPLLVRPNPSRNYIPNDGHPAPVRGPWDMLSGWYTLAAAFQNKQQAYVRIRVLTESIMQRSQMKTVVFVTTVDGRQRKTNVFHYRRDAGSGDGEAHSDQQTSKPT